MARKLHLALLAAAAAIAAIALFGGNAAPARADLGTTAQQLGALAGMNTMTLVPTGDPILADGSASQPATTNPPSLPPGTKWKLFGNAKDDTDPQNPYNDVISFDTADPASVAGAVKLFGDDVKVPMLENQIELKYFYVGRSCGGGSTRFQLGIDRDGDGQFDGNLFGYVGDKPGGAGGCVSGEWIYEDMTNTVPKWDGSQLQLPCNQACTWQQVETFMTTLYPNHRVLNEVLVDDSGSFVPTDKGCAYFDLVSAGQRTYVRTDDANENPNAVNNC